MKSNRTMHSGGTLVTPPWRGCCHYIFLRRKRPAACFPTENLSQEEGAVIQYDGAVLKSTVDFVFAKQP